MFFPIDRQMIVNHNDLLGRITDEFERINSFLGDYSSTTLPNLDIYSDDHNVLITADLPGIDPEKIEISVNGKTVTIAGERKARTIKEGEKCLMQERADINFNRTFTLPFNVDSNKVEAEYHNGVLNVSLPKVESEKPKTISVKCK